MPEPVTTSLVFVGSAVVSGILGNRSDAGFKFRWDKFKHNLEDHRPYANHELARAAYRAYLQATLQSCAALLERHGLKVEGWFKLGTLPEKLAIALRSLLSEAPAGVFTRANKQWLEAVSSEQIGKLKLLDAEKSDPPFEYEHQEFAALLEEIELLMQPEDAKDRMQLLRAALATRVLSDLEDQFGEAPNEFKVLVNERWFEFLCAGFQYYLKHRQEIANAFETRLLAKLVARSEWQHQLTDFGGESLTRIEAAQGWLLQEQRAGFERLESLVTLLLPLLSFASDEASRNETLMILIRAESERVIDEVGERVEAVGDSVVERVAAEFDRRLPPFLSTNALDPLIHTLPTQHDIDGREEECATILRAMSESKVHVLAFAAPGGFGKTALLAKVVRTISTDGETFLDRVTLPNGESIPTHTGALLHVDCRKHVKLSALFANSGRLIGQEQMFQDIYNSDANLSDKLQDVFSRLSAKTQGRTWFVFDNFEPLLNDKAEVANPELSELFSAIFLGGHNVHALIAAREVPRFSPRERVLELVSVGESLFEGLPLDDCIAYLKRNDAANGLDGSAEEIEAVLKSFTERVHSIPLALVWAAGYLRETGYTLKEVLERSDLFTDFDQEQAKDAERYENKGLKRLHYEQLKIQTSDCLAVLRLLAFFKCAVPKGALVHLLSEIELYKVLKRLERNNLITRKKSADALTLYLNDSQAVNLYALHPVICENELFDTLPEEESMYETAAAECAKRAAEAENDNSFAYAIELYDCAARLSEHVTKKFDRADLENNYAAMLMNKGNAFLTLARFPEALEELDKAIVILERLINVDGQTHLTNDLAGVYTRKSAALHSLKKLPEALVEMDKAIAILERLVNVEQRADLLNELANAHINKGVVLDSLTRFPDAVMEHERANSILERLASVEKQPDLDIQLATAYLNKGTTFSKFARFPEALEELDKAVAILERLVNVKRQTHLAGELAIAYVNRGSVFDSISQPREALWDYEQAIAILERLVNVEHQGQLAQHLATAYMNKGNAFNRLVNLPEAIEEYERAIAILERLVNVEQQAHRASDLARAYQNKGTALTTLTRLAEAIQETDKAIVILERLINVEQQVHLASDLAGTYVNRGAAFFGLTRFPEAVEEIDKGIAILERLVNVEQQAHLADQLARGYMNKARCLERQEEWERALSCYEQALQTWRICIDQLKMLRIMPEFLRALRCRLTTLVYLEYWPSAAKDVLAFLSLSLVCTNGDAIDAEVKQRAAGEYSQLIAGLCALSAGQAELLYAEFGEDAKEIRALIAEPQG